MSGSRLQPLTNGLFADHWIGTEAAMTFRSPGIPDEIRLTGVAPGGVNLPFPFHVTLTLNGAAQPSCIGQHPGRFELSCAIRSDPRALLKAGGVAHLVMCTEAMFTPPGDPRRLSLRLETVALRTRQ